MLGKMNQGPDLQFHMNIDDPYSSPEWQEKKVKALREANFIIDPQILSETKWDPITNEWKHKDIPLSTYVYLDDNDYLDQYSSKRNLH